MLLRLTACVTMLFFAGTPAATALCGYACEPTGVAVVSGHNHGGSVTPSRPADDHAHQHHSAAAAETRIQADMPSGARIADGNCCAEDDRALPSLRAAVRFETELMAAAPSSLGRLLEAARRSAVSTRAASFVPPPNPPSTPDVLRI